VIHTNHWNITELIHDTVDFSDDSDNHLDFVNECRFKFSGMCTVSLGE
jgi:hypothetical protein